MQTFTITISDEEKKALLVDMISIQEWIENSIHNKARQIIDRIVLENSDKQPNKITLEEKLQIVKDTPLETVQEWHDKFELLNK